MSGSFSAEQLQRLITDAGFSPEYGSGTLLLAGFNGNLEAGNLQSPTETIVGLALYRLLSGESRLRPVASVPLNDIGLIDYGFANQAEFQYYLFPQGEETYIAQPIVSPW